MNSEQAKKIDLPDLLSRLGYEPVQVTKGGRELWYRSPFRNEKEPSFHTSFLGGKWIWNDFGDAGGNVLDFVMRHQGIQFKEALAFLRNLYPGSLFEHSDRAGGLSRNPSSLVSFQQQSEQEETPPEAQRELEFLEAHEIRNPAILDYLEKQRKIPADLARLYLKEVQYRNKTRNKVFFAFGMENESGGYEIRTASDRYKFKSALIKRDITVIRGKGLERKSVSVFEGMTDFLSLLMLMKADRLEGDAIIMHSLSSFQRTVDAIRKFGYKHIDTFLDNNAPGQKCTEKFLAEFPTSMTVRSQQFAPHSDLNDALRAEFDSETLAIFPPTRS
ncbi:MAG: DNA primase [Saprospiraceae bacterium]|nr:DNA primase [Saprospiraceae bacterium]